MSGAPCSRPFPAREPHRWLYQLVRSYPSRPGKAIRPSLCLASCRSFGGREDEAFPVAVAIEMMHNAFLIHDDIADGSERRRGRPTLPADHGEALALNAGDALVVLANQLLRQHTRALEPSTADRVLAEFDLMALRTLEGQATELGWRRDRVMDVTPEDYLGLILHKTCWYTTIHPLRVGLILGAGAGNLHAMVRFGFYLGAAFQIRDDLLNLTGDESIYGKEINGDLYEGKRSLALIHLCGEVRGPDRTFLHDYLAMERRVRTAAIVEEVREPDGPVRQHRVLRGVRQGHRRRRHGCLRGGICRGRRWPRRSSSSGPSSHTWSVAVGDG